MQITDPKQVRMFSLGSIDDAAVGQYHFHRDDVVQRRSPHTRGVAVSTVQGVPGESNTAYVSVTIRNTRFGEMVLPWTCPVRKTPLSMFVEGCGDISQPVACTNDGLMGIGINPKRLELLHVDDQASICTTHSIASVRVASASSCNLDIVGVGTLDCGRNLFGSAGGDKDQWLPFHPEVEVLRGGEVIGG